MYLRVVHVTIENSGFYLALYLTGIYYIFEASYSTLVMGWAKNQEFDQSELEKQLVSDCKRNYKNVQKSLKIIFIQKFLKVENQND